MEIQKWVDEIQQMEVVGREKQTEMKKLSEQIKTLQQQYQEFKKQADLYENDSFVELKRKLQTYQACEHVLKSKTPVVLFVPFDVHDEETQDAAVDESVYKAYENRVEIDFVTFQCRAYRKGDEETDNPWTIWFYDTIEPKQDVELDEKTFYWPAFEAYVKREFNPSEIDGHAITSGWFQNIDDVDTEYRKFRPSQTGIYRIEGVVLKLKTT